jgi:polyisoprenyl-phosphate glycosyltransferase
VDRQKYSIIFSVYNEEDSLPLLFKELKTVDDLGWKFEIVFVNDGSLDNSLPLIKDFVRQNPFLNLTPRYITFSRNFGHEAAMIAGIDHATGDAAICMDADLQHPLGKLPEMIQAFNNGADIVNMVRNRNKGNSWLKSFFSKKFYHLFNRLSPLKLQENVSDFFLLSGKVAKILRTDYRERNRFLRGLIQFIGFKTVSLSYDAPKRKAGETKYPFSKLLVLTLNSVVSFSKKPLFLGIYFGFLFAFVAVALGIYTLATFLFGKTPPSGYTTIVLFISLSFSILFFLIGIIGIYVGYIFDEIKKRPIYIIEESSQ